jgi:hypothetical protein
MKLDQRIDSENVHLIQSGGSFITVSLILSLGFYLLKSCLIFMTILQGRLMKPYEHGRISAKKWGGRAEDYQEIHDFIDLPKSAHPDMRHRAILHNSLSPYICEKIFGTWKWEFHGKWWNPTSWFSWKYTKRPYIVNSEGKRVQIRDIAEQHIIDDMGRIPTLSDYLDEMPFYNWLGGLPKKVFKIKIVD